MNLKGRGSLHGQTVGSGRAWIMEFITGNQAIVRAALRAGCNYVAGYPITPASSILSQFVRAFAHGEGTVVQTEDELAAIGQCIGAAMAGAKALTATSGPGLCLYSENIGLAQMVEAPLVIVDCQRMGPATGGATATGDGDVLFAGHVSAGGFPLPVLAATDAVTAFRLTIEAFNIAERLRTPVILLTAKDIALTRQSVALEDVRLSPIESRRSGDDVADFHPYDFAAPHETPAFLPIGGARTVRCTGSIHDRDGLLTTDRSKIQRKLEHLAAKILSRRTELEYAELDSDDDAETLLISYGVADGATREAVSLLRNEGHHVAHLTLYSLWPCPEMAIRQAITAAVHRIIMPELNIGLYVHELRKLAPLVRVSSICRYDGGLIEPERIVDEVLSPVHV